MAMTASWLAAAQAADCDFPLQNLPYGVFSTANGPPRCGVAIGDRVLDLALAEELGLIHAGPTPVFRDMALNGFMALGAGVWQAVRDRLTQLLAVDGDPAIRDDAALQDRLMHAIADVTLHLPFRVAGYTDFNSSRQHAFNAGSMFRDPANALPVNWLHLPVAYNGRVSTIVVSGTSIHRPLGQRKTPGEAMPGFGPCERLDYELEMGTVVGLPSVMGRPLTVAEAEDLIFGYVLLNDWSARDIQAWETVPLGPFQAKMFATSISPWVVTKAALDPFRIATPPREVPQLPYLREPGPMLYDITLQASLRPEGQAQATTITRTNYRHMYYSAPQKIAHQADAACRPAI